MGFTKSLGLLKLFLSDAFLDVLFPSSCISCGRDSQRNKPMCDACWGGVSPAKEEFCFCCGESLGDVTYDDRVLCREKTHRKYRGKAVFIVSGEILSLVHAFKYRGRRFLGQGIGNLMALSLSESSFFKRDSLLLPVPLYRARKRERGFNQSEMLAAEVGRTVGLPVETNALTRRKPTRSQAELRAQERWENVRDSFSVECAPIVEGREIILVDDVMTTGATVLSCARALEAAGAGRVSVLSFLVA